MTSKAVNAGIPGHIDRGASAGVSELEAMLDCCPDWQPGLAKINGFIVLQSIRVGKDLYDGKPFIFCPWCGAKKSNVPLTGAP